MSAVSTGFRSSLRTCCGKLNSCAARLFLAGTAMAAGMAPDVLYGQQEPGIRIPDAGWTQPIGSGSPNPSRGIAARPVQFSMESNVAGKVDAIHSPNIDDMLAPQYRLEVAKRHSQLILTNRRVRRIAVTDSSIVNYVQFSEKEISVIGLELGRTDLTLWFEDEATPSIYEVTVIRDQSLEEQRTIDFGHLERRLAKIFPNSNVALMPIGNQVIVRGQAFDAEEATQILQIVRAEVIRTLGRAGNLDDDNAAFTQVGNTLGGGGGGFNNQFGQAGFRDIVVNMMEVPGEYNVKMRVIIAEVDRSQLRNAGLNVNVLFHNQRQGIGMNLGGGTGGTSQLQGIFENGQINVLLNWLQSNGTVTLLAESNLVTLSGHPASLLGGGEFAVPTTIGLGGGQTTTFRGFGTSLIVTPTVLDRDRFRLQLVPESSQLNQANTVNGIPGTNVKRVSTTIELREGQTIAIGGIISRQTLGNVARIPMLGDIPYFGSRLFHSKSASELETELLVLVSPEIVRPMEPDEVPPLPNDYITHPNDYDLWKYGRTEGNPDTNVYQIPPWGTGATYGTPVGYSLFNPPVNHPGVPTIGGSQGYSGGGQQYGSMLTPQPEYGMHQGGQPTMPTQQFSYPGPSQPMPSGGPMYPSVPGQMQTVPMMPQGSPGVGGAPMVPPIPPAYPTQGSVQQQNNGGLTRLTSVFRRNTADRSAAATPPVQTAGWSQNR